MELKGCVISTVCVGIVVVQLVRKVLPWLYYNIIGPNLMGPKVDLRSQGKWAVVTGATDGIGKAYAKALAKNGLNLVLISRSYNKLENVAKELGDAFKVETKIIDVDFTGGPEIYEKIQQQIVGLDIGVLVNNVGISSSYPEYFVDYLEKNPNFLRDITAANIHSVTHMCALALPCMLVKKKGVIINLSSATSVIPSPLLSVYGATKSFVNKFSGDLQTEYRSDGIIVQSVRPGYVATNMTKIRKSSYFVPSPDTYVKSAIKTIGIAENTAGYLPHAIFQFVVHLLAAVIGKHLTRKIVFGQLQNSRKLALRKLQKKQ